VRLLARIHKKKDPSIKMNLEIVGRCLLDPICAVWAKFELTVFQGNAGVRIHDGIGSPVSMGQIS